MCTPLKIFKIDTDDIRILVAISLSMIPILKADLTEMRNACKAKGMNLNIKNSKYMMSKFMITLIFRINQIEESLISKGYGN